MWVEFVVGFRPCSEGFSPGTPVSGFLPSIKTNISKFQFDLDVKCLLMSPWLGRLGDYCPHYDVKFDLPFDLPFYQIKEY